MPPAVKLGYLVFDVRRPARWERFCRAMLGLPAPLANADGSQGWQVDGAAQRLIVRAGRADDLAALGLACADDRVLDDLVARIERAGVRVQDGGPELARARRVRRLACALDPAGNRVELHAGEERAAQLFASPLVRGGFATGDFGLGHAVLVARDLEAMEQFYVEALGFGVSERLATKVGPIRLRGVFLHCNRRHHSLALFDLPLRKRMHHFMLQVAQLADVGTAFERAERLGVPLSLGLGQHPDPDGTFSFYGQTPSGFDFEIGAGGKEIAPDDWCELTAQTTSAWGHKPRLRLRLKMAKELVVAGLRQ